MVWKGKINKVIPSPKEIKLGREYAVVDGVSKRWDHVIAPKL